MRGIGSQKHLNAAVYAYEAVRIGQPHFVKETNFLRSVFSAQGLLVDLRQTSMGGFAVLLVQIQTRAVHGRHHLVEGNLSGGIQEA